MLFLLGVFIFISPPHLVHPVSCIPNSSCSRALGLYLDPRCFLSPAFSLEKLCSVLFFPLWLRFPGFCAELWLARPGVGKTLVAPAGFYGWRSSQWSFSVFRTSRRSVLFPLRTEILSFQQETFVPFLVAFCSACVI